MKLNDDLETDPKDYIIRLEGSETSFRCDFRFDLPGDRGHNCGCNVFRKLKSDPRRFKCNACGSTYTSE